MLRAVCTLALFGVAGVLSASAQTNAGERFAEQDVEEPAATNGSSPTVEPAAGNEVAGNENESFPIEQLTRLNIVGVDPVRPAAKPFKGEQGPASDSEPFVGPPAPILDADSARLSFQALLTDAGGEPLPGPTVNLVFNIYRGGGGPLIQGPIPLNNVAIVNGVVNTQVPVSPSSFDGFAREMGVKVNGGPELSPRTPLTAVAYAYRVDRVASEELDDFIELGDATNGGRLGVWSNILANLQSIVLDGNNHAIQTFGDDGLEQIRLWGNAYGEIFLHDSTDNNRTVTLSATSNQGGQLTLTDADEVDAVFANGGDGTVNVTGSLNAVESIGGLVNASLISNSANGGRLDLLDPIGNAAAIFGGNALLGGGFGQYYQNGGGIGITLIAQTLSGSEIHINNHNGDSSIVLDGEKSGGGAHITMKDDANIRTVELHAGASGAGGAISVYDSGGTNATIVLAAEEAAGQGSQITLRNAAGDVTIEIDGDFFGDGRVTTQELQITGGSDLSEQFNVKSARGRAEPGMVVSIDPNDPGQLLISTGAYDRKVAGIISGAGGIETGLIMGQAGSVADGEYPIALTGRVYCMVDTSNGPIKPGDLLTTSDIPGHAMKVTDYGKAQGAIIGKAMTGLDTGRGLVLVLVSLQ